MSNYSSSNTLTSPLPQLRHVTLRDFVYGFEDGSLTSEQLVETYLARVDEVNHELRAVVETNPAAVEDARLLDREHRLQGPRGMIHGLPILLKDNIPTLDDTDSTCGSLALVGARPPAEAAVVTALRNAGAVILGKGNMAEWSGFRSTSGCSGWSARGGQTKGIYYPGQKASGSSSGCAVAVALGLCFAAIGTETFYSIVSPAEKSGIIGFKPTRGVLPSTGIIHASQALDTIGLLTRRVADATALLLELIYHSTHHPAPAKLSLLRSLTPACTSLDLSSLRIGILSSLPAIHPAKLPVFNQLLSLLTASGAELVHNVHIPGLAVYAALSPAQKSIVLETHMQAAVNNYLYSLRTNPQNITSIEDLVAFTQTCPGEEFSRRNTVVLERAAASNQHRGMYDAMVELDKWFASDGGIPGALDRAGCDVLLCPALYVPLQTFASKAGVPVLSVPMGMFPPNTRIQQDEGSGMVDVAPGMPFSVYVYAHKGADRDVLRVGELVERAMGVGDKLKPYLAPQAEIRVGGREPESPESEGAERKAKGVAEAE